MAGPLAEEGDPMKSRIRAAVILAALAVFAVVGVAQAQQLKISRAAKANQTFTKLLCSATDDPEGKCVSSKSGGCKRISAPRVRCSLFLTLEGEDKSQVRCRAQVEWVLDNKTNAIKPVFLGLRSCTEVRGPEVTPAPTG
jgi:uncharacterized low-complexity protein